MDKNFTDSNPNVNGSSTIPRDNQQSPYNTATSSTPLLLRMSKNADCYILLPAFVLGCMVNLFLFRLLSQPPFIYIRCTAALFLIRSIALLDCANLCASALMTWSIHCSNLMDILHPSYFALNLVCKLYNVFTHLPLICVEWNLVGLAFERLTAVVFHTKAYQTYFTALRLKIGFLIFSAITTAALCNYLWIFGRPSNMQHAETSCRIVETFATAYYTVIIFVEASIEFIAPNTIVLLCVICITVTLSVNGWQDKHSLITTGPTFPRDSPSQEVSWTYSSNQNNASRSRQQSRLYSNPALAANPYLSCMVDSVTARVLLQVFFSQVFISIGCALPQNLARFVSILAGESIWTDFQQLNRQLHVIRFVLRGLVTLILFGRCRSKLSDRSSGFITRPLLDSV